MHFSTTRVRTLAAFSLSITLVARPARAQARDTTVYVATVTTSGERFSDTPPADWLWNDVVLRRASGRTSLALQGIAARRFGQWDRAVAGEAYTGLSRTSYGYLRVQLTPGAKVLPTTDLSGEFFEGLSGGWEGSLGVRRMNYADAGSTIGTIGIGRTIGANYLRARYIALLGASGGAASAVALTARRYGRAIDSYIEGGTTLGREVVSIGANQAYDIRGSTSAYLRAQGYLTPRFGLAGLLSLTSQQRIPTRVGVSLSAMARW